MGLRWPLALPYLVYALTMSTPNLKATTRPDLASLVVPRPGSAAGIGWLAHLAARPSVSLAAASAAGYIGIPLLLVALVLAVTSWSSRIVRFLTCMLAFIVVVSLGPALYLEGHRVGNLPWHGLWSLPFLRNAWASRLMLFAYLVLAVATAMFLARPRKLIWLRWVLGLLVIFAVVQDTPVLSIAPHSTVPTFISSGAYRQHLRPGEIVVVVSNIGNAGMLWQADTDFYTQLAGGYINQALTSRTDLPEAGAEPLEGDPGDRLEVRVVRQGRRDRRHTHRPQPRAIVGRHLQEDGPTGPVRRQCHRVPDQRLLDLPSPQRGAAHDPAR